MTLTNPKTVSNGIVSFEQLVDQFQNGPNFWYNLPTVSQALWLVTLKEKVKLHVHESSEGLSSQI